MPSSTCKLIEFNETGAVSRVHVPAGTSTSLNGRHRAPAPDDWLVTRLSRGQIVVISRPEELPTEAVAARESARRTMGYSILGVPAPISGQTICALTIEATGVSRRWPQALIESVQQIAGTCRARCSRGDVRLPAADVDEIERINARLEADNRYLKEEIKTIHDFEEIVGESAPLRLGLARLAQVAPMNSSVLLLGPTGTGKELFARALHERSRRHARALVRVNCAALPPTLVESELFGHEKGAFTGAVGMRQGRFEMADGGTIFLDEIGDLTPDVQVKFLRVLQEGEFERVGSSRTTQDRRPRHRRDAPGPRSGGRRRPVPRRPLLPAERVSDSPAVAAGAGRRHPAPGLVLHQPPSARPRPADHRDSAARDRRAAGAHLAGQRPRARERHRPRDDRVGRQRAAARRAAARSPQRTAPAPKEAPDHLDAVQRAHIEAVLQRCGWRINGAGNAAECLGLHPEHAAVPDEEDLGWSRPDHLIHGVSSMTLM